IGFDRLRRTAIRRRDARLQRLPRSGYAGDLRRELERHPLLLEHAAELATYLVVDSRQDAVEELDHDDLGAETAPDRTKLEADHTGADDEQPLRHLGERQRPGGGHDALLVDLDAGA